MEIKEHNGKPITSGTAIYNVITAILAAESDFDREKEHFFTIGLDKKRYIKYVDLISLGTLSTSIIHPRETFRLAVMKGIDSLIVAHNHPSGKIEASAEDVAITQRLTRAGEILGIKLLDHVIVGNGNFLSMLESGLLTAENNPARIQKTKEEKKTLRGTLSDLNMALAHAQSEIYSIKAICQLCLKSEYTTLASPEPAAHWYSIFSIVDDIASKADHKLNEVDDLAGTCRRKAEEMLLPKSAEGG